MISDKKLARFLIKYVFNPTVVFFVYFLFVSLFGLSGKDAWVIYAVIFPWVFFMLLILYAPFIIFLFHITKMEKSKKINHVLEHGTIYYLKEKYNRKHRVGGSASTDGFRIYGKIDSPGDIEESFDKLKHYLSQGKSSIVLSKFCGSSTHILGGISFILLTITFIAFLFVDLELSVVKYILLANVILYFLLRFPVGKYVQKKFTMCFEFSEPQITLISKVKKKGFWESSPVYFIKTDYNSHNT